MINTTEFIIILGFIIFMMLVFFEIAEILYDMYQQELKNKNIENKTFWDSKIK
jgi:hypothetical protein